MEDRRRHGPDTPSDSHIRKRPSQRDDLGPPPDLILPEPTLTAVDQTKKSHAKKQPAGHIPRPRNAFILFRCDFVRQKKIPASVEKDHRNISRIIGKIWKQMSAEQKEPWKKMADQEKIIHHERYPDFKFPVKAPTKKTSARVTQDDPGMKMEILVPFESERASSCPPGDKVISQSSFESLPPQYGDPLKTRDDLARQPSSTVYYRSAPFDLDTEMQDPAFFSNPANQRYYLRESRNRRKRGFTRPPEQESDQQQQQQEPASEPEARGTAAVGMFCGPRLFEENLQLLRDPFDEPLVPQETLFSLIPFTMTEMTPRLMGKPITVDHTRERFPSESLFSTLPPLPRNLLPDTELDAFETLPSALYHTFQNQLYSGSSDGQTNEALVKAEGQQGTILEFTCNM